MQQDMKSEVEKREQTREALVKRYKEHMRQVLHHQQEAYFCMVEILSTLSMDNDF